MLITNLLMCGVGGISASVPELILAIILAAIYVTWPISVPLLLLLFILSVKKLYSFLEQKQWQADNEL